VLHRGLPTALAVQQLKGSKEPLYFKEEPGEHKGLKHSKRISEPARLQRPPGKQHFANQALLQLQPGIGANTGSLLQATEREVQISDQGANCEALHRKEAVRILFYFRHKSPLCRKSSKSSGLRISRVFF